MTKREKPTCRDVEKNKKRLGRSIRFYAVIFRVILLAGLVLLLASAVLLIITDLFSNWILLIPLGLISLGIILARVEYRLNLRLYNLQNQDPPDENQ